MITFENRPTSAEELKSILDKAYEYARKEQYTKALQICEWIMENPATEVDGIRERAVVREHMDDLNGAIEDRRCIVAMNTGEPADYYHLGLVLLQIGDAAEAIICFSKVIEIGESADFHYYTNSALIHRAEAALRVKDWELAKSDCQRLPAGSKDYIYGKGMRTREQIESEAHP